MASETPGLDAAIEIMMRNDELGVEPEAPTAEDARAELARLKQAAEQRDRLASAIQGFRQLPMLVRYLRLRSTPEYAELCNAWRETSELYTGSLDDG